MNFYQPSIHVSEQQRGIIGSLSESAFCVECETVSAPGPLFRCLACGSDGLMRLSNVFNREKYVPGPIEGALLDIATTAGMESLISKYQEENAETCSDRERRFWEALERT